MLKVLSKELRILADKIDAGTSYLNEADVMQILQQVKTIADDNNRMSKYESCSYLNVSRATFDNFVASGDIPKGTKQVGWKELYWRKNDLDNYLVKKVKQK